MPEHGAERPAARAFWSGTITFGLVNIPVDLFAAVRSRRTSMKMVDVKGRPLGRAYYCPEDDKALSNHEIVRGYETDDGEMVVVTDEELDSVAPEMTRDIELRRFVPLAQIPPAYFQRPYFLAPSGRSSKAYHLLARTMERTGRVGIGTFVMRGHQYLVAVLSEGGVLRASTLRFADEIRTPEDVGLPARAKVAGKQVKTMMKAIEALRSDEVNEDELSDRYAGKLRELAEGKEEKGEDVVDTSAAGDEEEEEGGGAEVIDLVALLKQRLAAKGAGEEAPRGGHKREEAPRGSRQREEAPRRKQQHEREEAPRGFRQREEARRKKQQHEREEALRKKQDEREERPERSAAKRAAAGSKAPSRRNKADKASAAAASKEDLYERAKALDIPGRSKMSKRQLAKAVAAAS